MKLHTGSPSVRLAAALLIATSLSACNTFTRLSQVGEEPKLSKIDNPAAKQASVTMPMPTPMPVERQANSLWRPGARAFFKDQRATQIGDILTVTINIADTASLTNSTTRTRNNSESADTSNLLGLERKIWERIPGNNNATLDPTNLINLGSQSNSTGTGQITRQDTIALRVAAVVTQVLPNGNLVVNGSQEVRVNFETRVLQIAGVIRPQDIQSDNAISYDRIAEARIAYGGRGQITDMQQPRWGQQIYDIVFPF
jgi:flagellar L-ring protein precursor FlgH